MSFNLDRCRGRAAPERVRVRQQERTMTKRSSFKKLVRERMKKTGESYSTARRHVIAADAAQGPSTHYPGINPASTALRILLAAAGVFNPASGKPFSEAMLLG